VESRKIYEDIARRTDGDIYIGVVGPVRTGKSTFIKRFMEKMVIPNIDNAYRRERARDEMPQSGSGRMVMTAEPKFVPEEAVEIAMDGGGRFFIRMIDCVGYMVPGATGQYDGELERMVTTPWFPQPIPMAEAAEIGTRKVISEHSTIGIVVTTDGTITEIPRENYLQAEMRVIEEMKEIGKPFLVLLNSAEPSSSRSQAIRDEIISKYDVTCVTANCLEIGEMEIAAILKAVLYEFPLQELDLFMPPWVDALPYQHPIKSSLFEAIRSGGKEMFKIRDVEAALSKMRVCDNISGIQPLGIQLGTGVAAARLELPRSLFYRTLNEQSGFDVEDDGDLITLLTNLSKIKSDYDKISTALGDVYEKGYGIVAPSIDELTLEEPEIVRQGGRYGVRLKASAPSVHMIRANIQTEVSPIVGTEKQSEELISYLLDEFEGNTAKIWDSNIFGKSFHELVGEDLQAKLKRMPEDAQKKLQETLQRIINEGSGGLICIIL